MEGQKSEGVVAGVMFFRKQSIGRCATGSRSPCADYFSCQCPILRCDVGICLLCGPRNLLQCVVLAQLQPQRHGTQEKYHHNSRTNNSKTQAARRVHRAAPTAFLILKKPWNSRWKHFSKLGGRFSLALRELFRRQPLWRRICAINVVC